MAGTKYGNPDAAKLALQKGAEIDEEQDGSIKGRATFKGDASLWSTRPQKGDAHPFNAQCFCFSARTTYEGLQLCRVDADYMGLSQDPTTPFIEFVGSVGEEAIETHKNFVSVIGGTPAAPLNDAVFDSDGTFLGFPADAPNELGGVRSYYRPSVILRLSYWTNEIPNPAALGTVFEADGIPVNVPPNCANFLMTNFGYRSLTPETPPYQVTTEYLGSGPNGWNGTIYES